MKTCIYCGGSPLTREDIIPRYLQRLFATNGSKSVRDSGEGIAADGRSTYQSTTSKAGGALVQRPKIVCAGCNNVWMSAIQSEVATLLKSAMVSFPLLDPKALETLVRWAAMTTISYDALVDGGCALPQSYRDDFNSSKLPNADWAIWLGHFVGIVRHATDRQRHIYTRSSAGDPIFVLKTCAFSIGHLAIFVLISGREDNLSNNWMYANTAGLVRIYPLQDQCVIEPSPKIDDAKFENLADQPISNLYQRIRAAAAQAGVETTQFTRKEAGY